MPRTPDYFAGKTIIITGAASGIGRATALIFAREHANVVCVDLNEIGARETAALVNGKGSQAIALKVDVTVRKEVDDMVHAWVRGDTAWFETQLKSELGKDPKLYQSVLVARNRKWIPKIEALLNDDKNYLVIVGTAHLIGQGSVIDLLKKDGIGATQR